MYKIKRINYLLNNFNQISINKPKINRINIYNMKCYVSNKAAGKITIGNNKNNVNNPKAPIFLV